MSNASSKYRGGHIELSPDRPRGLPFLKPLYGLPPYQYTNELGEAPTTYAERSLPQIRWFWFR